MDGFYFPLEDLCIVYLKCEKVITEHIKLHGELNIAHQNK